jgi:hypothetical protein
VAAASSTDPTAVFLASANADAPLFSGNDVRNARWYVGGHFGIAGIAQPTNLSTITSLGSVPSYVSTALNATPDKIVQSIEGSIDLGVKLFKGERSIPGGTFRLWHRAKRHVSYKNASFLCPPFSAEEPFLHCHPRRRAPLFITLRTRLLKTRQPVASCLRPLVPTEQAQAIRQSLCRPAT